MSAEANADSPFTLHRKTEVAAFFGVSVQTVRNWELAGMPFIKLDTPIQQKPMGGRRGNSKGASIAPGQSLEPITNLYPADQIAKWLISGRGPYHKRQSSRVEPSVSVAGDDAGELEAWMAANPKNADPDQKRGWAARANELELNVLTKMRILAPTAELSELLMRCMVDLRRIAEQAEKKAELRGDEIAGQLRSMMEGWARGIEDQLGGGETALAESDLAAELSDDGSGGDSSAVAAEGPVDDPVDGRRDRCPDGPEAGEVPPRDAPSQPIPVC